MYMMISGGMVELGYDGLLVPPISLKKPKGVDCALWGV